MKLNPDSYTIAELVQRIEGGRLAIPEFQRRFVWRPGQIADLMVSIARSWPVGSLLLLDGPADFAVRAIEGAPPLSEAELLILDGQQRVTAIYQALGIGSADEVYVLDIAGLVDTGELGDEHIRSRRRSTFMRQYPDLQRRARAGIIALEDVVEDAVFAEWVEHAECADRTELYRLRKEELGGLMSYRLPAVRLDRNIDMAALAKIFETINRTGERLRAFDLMVARLYPHAFNLAEEWETALVEHPVLERFAVDGLELLRLIALTENVRQHRAADERVTVRGIRQGDVLRLEARTVRDRWEWSVEAYVRALEFVWSHCGVVDLELLPSPTMLLPTAMALDKEDERSLRAVEGWWWAAVLSQNYAQGANTQAIRDARDLADHLAGANGAPGVVERFEPDVEVLRDTRRRNESYLRGLMGLLVVDGAQDWISGRQLKDMAEPMVLHQVFPASWLEPRGINADSLLNITVLPKETHEQMAQAEPQEYLGTRMVKANAVRSHGLDVKALRENDWQTFAARRQGHVLRQLETVAKRSRASFGAA